MLIDDQGRPRLSDYELGQLIDVSQFTSAGGSQTAAWTAPELMEFSDTESSTDGVDGGVTTASDVFAFAMVCIEVSLNVFVVYLSPIVLCACCRYIPSSALSPNSKKMPRSSCPFSAENDQAFPQT